MRKCRLDPASEAKGPAAPRARDRDDVLLLQRAAGNRAVCRGIDGISADPSDVHLSRMFKTGGFNPKGLTITIPEKREYNGAVPHDYRMGTCQPISLIKARYGMGVNMHWKSTSNRLLDLEGVKSKELVNPVRATGTLAGLQTVVSDWQHIETTHGYAVDEHGIPSSSTTGSGTAEADQLFLYKTPFSETPMVADKSGFKIEKFIEQDPSGPTGQMRVRTEKKGAAVTVEQYTAAAGEGSDRTIEPVPPPSVEDIQKS